MKKSAEKIFFLLLVLYNLGKIAAMLNGLNRHSSLTLVPTDLKYSGAKNLVHRRKRNSTPATKTNGERAINLEKNSEYQPLYIEVYKTFCDAAVLDWFIPLAEKDKMSSCDMEYHKLGSHSSMTSSGRDDSSNRSVVYLPNYLPTSRTFVLKPLEANATYVFRMKCSDLSGKKFATELISLQTDFPGTPSINDNLNATSAVKDVSEISPSQNNFVSLAAVAASSVVQRSSHNEVHHWAIRPRVQEKVSPHLVLGASCGVLGLIIIVITAGLAFTKYRRYKRANTASTHADELQTTADSPVSVIGGPPPYTEEQPPPQYSFSQPINNNIIYQNFLPISFFGRNQFYGTDENSSTQLFFLANENEE